MNRYKEIDTLKDTTGTRFKRNAIYPEIPLSENDTYIITSVTDRYDTLALQFYNDASLWWIIAMSNTTQRSSLVVEPGVQLRIPANPTKIVEAFNKLNKIR